jgi:hypothetical protein
MFETALRMIATHGCVVAIAFTGKRRVAFDLIDSRNLFGVRS